MRLLCSLLVLSIGFSAADLVPVVCAQETVETPQLERWESRLLARFERKVLPLLTDTDNGCVDCHSTDSHSNLMLSGDGIQDLRHLLDGGYLGTSGPDTLIGRVTSENPDRRMPKDGPRWEKSQVRRLQRFVELAKRQQIETGRVADEQFPRSLLFPYHDNDPTTAVAPTQFLTYRQLKAKVATVFGDDWVRGGRDRFAENIAAFGGADFQTRFNESREPSAAYLSALEVLARDVSSVAYRRRTGPFQDFPALSADASNESLKQAVDQIYRRVLYRSPSDDELQASLELLQSIRDLDDVISQRDVELTFQVTVTDPDSGLSESKLVVMPVRGDRSRVAQSVIDQRPPRSNPDRWLEHLVADLSGKIAQQVFDAQRDSAPGQQSLGWVRLGPDQTARVVIHNRGTRRTVSFAEIVVRDEAGDVVESIAAESQKLIVDGAWTQQNREGRAALEDGNQHKGMSTITVPLASVHDGRYEILMKWNPSTSNAHNVLVELHGSVDQNELLSSSWVVPDTPGQAMFFYDCGNDTVPYVELPGSYRFDANGFIEISNRGTYQRVTAGAIDLVNAADPANNFLIDSKFAKGADQWEKFGGGMFGSYNVRGEKLHDNNRNKGKLTLRYMLEDRVDHGWRPDQFYKIRVYYPGKSDHEPLVPVAVHAVGSSPVVQVRYPLIAKSDAVVELDASPSYTVHQSELQFHWEQLTGPPVTVDNWNQPKIQFEAPRQSAVEMAWISACAALVQHPDFLFTHPQTAEGKGISTAPLMKVAMDLIGRPPSGDELRRLASGEPLETFIDEYLDSQAFRDFYFHRVRLYLESQGTPLQDEPVRLWSYVAFNDRPFQEILTADYTVDESFAKVARPEYHGRTGVLTTKGFIAGKPGLPHYNYAAQVSMLFLGYVYEVPPEIVEQREGITALGTTDPNSSCYSCHKVLTPLAFQRSNWTDDGEFRLKDESGLEIDASDRGAVEEYPFKGDGIEAFAMQAVKKERFVRTMINTHVQFYFGRQMRYREDERELYRRLWDNVHQHNFKIRELIRAIVTSPEYLGEVNIIAEVGSSPTVARSHTNGGGP